MIHRLKTWSEYIIPIVRGEKTFEVRKNDRNFQVGDTLLLISYDRVKQKENSNYIEVKITYILTGGQFGIEEGYCVMGIRLIDYNF